MKLLLLFPFFLLLSNYLVLGKDPSKEALNEQKPFRMGKLNLLWQKATKRLSKEKLLKLHSELKIQDTEELTFKKLKAAGGDKDGMKEAALRKKLLGIATRYSLSDQYDDVGEEKIDKRKLEKVDFKDKKLNKLWLKAEQSGLTQLELKALKEEFQHHQEKIDEYHMLISQVGGSHSANDVANDIHEMGNLQPMDEKNENYNEHINVIRDKHRELKTNLESLVQKSNGAESGKDFTEPEVESLWQIAIRGDFTDSELESLKQELKHFETKLQKLNHMENNMNKASVGKYEDMSHEDKEKILSSTDLEGRKILVDRLSKQKRYVDKMQGTLEQKIMARHNEL